MSLNVNIPRLGTIEDFDPPRFVVQGPIEFMFPPDKWMETMRQWHGDEVALQMFVKEKTDIPQAKHMLRLEFTLMVCHWANKLTKWSLDLQDEKS